MPVSIRRAAETIGDLFEEHQWPYEYNTEKRRFSARFDLSVAGIDHVGIGTDFDGDGGVDMWELPGDEWWKLYAKEADRIHNETDFFTGKYSKLNSFTRPIKRLH